MWIFAIQFQFNRITIFYREQHRWSWRANIIAVWFSRSLDKSKQLSEYFRAMLHSWTWSRRWFLHSDEISRCGEKKAASERPADEGTPGDSFLRQLQQQIFQ